AGRNNPGRLPCSVSRYRCLHKRSTLFLRELSVAKRQRSSTWSFLLGNGQKLSTTKTLIEREISSALQPRGNLIQATARSPSLRSQPRSSRQAVSAGLEFARSAKRAQC